MKYRLRWIGILLIPSCYFLVTFLILAFQPPISAPTQNRSEVGNRSTKYISFIQELATIPWEEFSEADYEKDTNRVDYFVRLLLQKLTPFLAKSPIAPVNHRCGPTPLSIPPDIICERLEKPRRVGVLLQLGLDDADALEIHLHELDAIVNKFFLVESTQPCGDFIKGQRMPSLWELIKDDERFSEFLPKIVHFVVDRSDLEEQYATMEEGFEARLRWTKFLDWNNDTKFFSTSDLLGFADTDEIPHRDNIYYLKNCEFPSESVDIGLWFPFGGMDTILQVDHPIQDHPFAHAGPSYWTLRAAIASYKEIGLIPTRMKGESWGYLLGGLHMSTYHYPPHRFYKFLTSRKDDNDLDYIDLIIKSGNYFINGQHKVAEAILNHWDKIRGRLETSRKFNTTRRTGSKVKSKKAEEPEFVRIIPRSPMVEKILHKRERFRGRLRSLRDFKVMHKSEADETVKIPWFYDCNRKRFPGLEGRHDPRLD